jgi:aspartate carbamoyltransferase regulatory subunit
MKKEEKNSKKNSKTRKIPAIKDGIAIDHILSGNALKVIEILDVHHDKQSVITIGMNLSSKKMGKKDVVKIENKNIQKQQLAKISLIAPNASISFINNYKVFDKMIIKIPDIIENIVKCQNYNCITNHQQVSTKFYKTEKNQKLSFRCHHCEKSQSIEEIELK